MRRAAGIGGALLAAIALLAAGAIAVAPASGSGSGPLALDAGKGKSVKVKVGDDFFTPTELKIKKGTKVKWKWLPDNFNPHNVTLEKGPKSLSKKEKKDLKSATGAIGIKFNRKLKKTGAYDFVCTIHSTVMKQTIKVKK